MSYLWHPHTQLFNVLLSVFLISLSRTVLREPNLPFQRLILICLVSGLLCTFYGSFILTLPVIILSYLIAISKNPPTPFQADFSSLAVRLMVITVLIALPSLVWVLITTYTAGHYYHHEIARYRQFIWVLDVLKGGGIQRLLQVCLLRLAGFLEVLTVVLWPYLLLLMSSLLIFRVLKIRFRDISSANKLNLAASMTAIVPVLVFFYLGHAYKERLLWNAVPPLLVIMGVLLCEVTSSLDRKRRLLVNIPLLLIAAAPLAVGHPYYSHMILKRIYEFIAGY